MTRKLGNKPDFHTLRLQDRNEGMSRAVVSHVANARRFEWGLPVPFKEARIQNWTAATQTRQRLLPLHTRAWKYPIQFTVYGVSTARHGGLFVKQYVDDPSLLEAEQEFLCLFKPLHECAYLIGPQKNSLCTRGGNVDLLMYEQGFLFRNPLSTYKRVEAWMRIQYEFPERHSANTKNPKK